MKPTSKQMETPRRQFAMQSTTASVKRTKISRLFIDEYGRSGKIFYLLLVFTIFYFRLPGTRPLLFTILYFPLFKFVIGHLSFGICHLALVLCHFSILRFEI